MGDHVCDNWTKLQMRILESGFLGIPTGIPKLGSPCGVWTVVFEATGSRNPESILSDSNSRG